MTAEEKKELQKRINEKADELNILAYEMKIAEAKDKHVVEVEGFEKKIRALKGEEPNKEEEAEIETLVDEKGNKEAEPFPATPAILAEPTTPQN